MDGGMDVSPERRSPSPLPPHHFKGRHLVHLQEEFDQHSKHACL